MAGRCLRPGRGEFIGFHSGCPQHGRQMPLLGKRAANSQSDRKSPLFTDYFVKLILMQFFRTWSVSGPRNDLEMVDGSRERKPH